MEFEAVTGNGTTPTAADGEDSVNAGKRTGRFKLLARLTLEDPQTGLVNQLLLHDRLAQALTRSKRHGDRVAVFYIDLNYFQGVNEKYGFEAGNAVLCVVAQRLSAIIRSEDTLSRVGGNEFVAVLSIQDEQSLGLLTTRFQSVFDEPFDIAGTAVPVTASFGIVLGDGGASAEEVLAQADEAMGREKGKRPLR
jgi:diguanylate cyclase (GGDEF)-like protein